MKEISYFVVTQQTDEREWRVLGNFSTRLAAEFIAKQNPGWYGAPSTVRPSRTQVFESPDEWQAVIDGASS
jgi:hypothetical protein